MRSECCAALGHRAQPSVGRGVRPPTRRPPAETEIRPRMNSGGTRNMCACPRVSCPFRAPPPRGHRFPGWRCVRSWRTPLCPGLTCGGPVGPLPVAPLPEGPFCGRALRRATRRTTSAGRGARLGGSGKRAIPLPGSGELVADFSPGNGRRQSAGRHTAIAVRHDEDGQTVCPTSDTNRITNGLRSVSRTAVSNHDDGRGAREGWHRVFVWSARKRRSPGGRCKSHPDGVHF